LARRKPIETAGAADKDVTDSRRNPEGTAIRLGNDLSEQKNQARESKQERKQTIGEEQCVDGNCDNAPMMIAPEQFPGQIVMTFLIRP